MKLCGFKMDSKNNLWAKGQQRDKPKIITETELNKKNQYINYTQPLLLLLILWCDIIATSIGDFYVLIEIRDKEQYKVYQKINWTKLWRQK